MKLLRIFGFITLVILLIAGVLFYTQVYDYARYPLKVDRAKFPNVSTDTEIEALAEELVDQMTVDEKIEQLYGEPNSSVVKLAVNRFRMKRCPPIAGPWNGRPTPPGCCPDCCCTSKETTTSRSAPR